MFKSPAPFGYFSKLLGQAETRRAIHVGNLTFNNGQESEKHLIAVQKSVSYLRAIATAFCAVSSGCYAYLPGFPTDCI